MRRDGHDDLMGSEMASAFFGAFHLSASQLMKVRDEVLVGVIAVVWLREVS